MLAVRVSCVKWGVGIAQWLEHWTHGWKVKGLNPCRSGGRIFFSRVNFLCWLLCWYPFHPRVTTVARKRPQSFRQKCRWQVTAKHACTLCMWLCMKWHVWCTQNAPRWQQFMWHQPCQCCKYTTLVDIQKRAIKKASHSCRITCEHSESAREWTIALYKSDQQQQKGLDCVLFVIILSLFSFSPSPLMQIQACNLFYVSICLPLLFWQEMPFSVHLIWQVFPFLFSVLFWSSIFDLWLNFAKLIYD